MTTIRGGSGINTLGMALVYQEMTALQESMMDERSEDVSDAILHSINTYLLRWIQKKYRAGMKQALWRLAEGHTRRPTYFAHWTWVTPARARTRTTRAV